MSDRLKTMVELTSIIVIIIGLIFVVQYKMLDMETQTAYEINLSIYQDELDDYHIELDRYNQGIIYHASQMKTLDGTQTAGEVSVININGGILMDHGKRLQSESTRLDGRYNELNVEKENIDSPINILIDRYQENRRA